MLLDQSDNILCVNNTYFDLYIYDLCYLFTKHLIYFRTKTKPVVYRKIKTPAATLEPFSQEALYDVALSVYSYFSSLCITN